MSEPQLEIDLGPEAPAILLKDWDAAERWLREEEQAWSWLSPSAHNPAATGEVVQERLRWFRQTFQNHRVGDQRLDGLQGAVAQVFGANGPVFPTESVKGKQVQDLRQSCGEDGAAAAYAFMLGRMPLGNVTTLNQLRAVLLTAFPPFEPAADLTDRLSRERANIRATHRNTLNDLQTFEQRRESEWRSLLRRASRIGINQLRSGRTSWKNQQSALHKQQLDAITDINAVKNSYEESMRLLGPVRYWTQKARAHGKSEFWAVVRLCIYFPIALGLLGWAFYEAFSLLLDGNPRKPDTPLPQATYFVVSAALLLVSTFAFWIGRLLTKLYLSEHHLRIDAHERAVMTTTYLALIRSGAASDTERTIILEALFRQSADGIVKDDGPGDLNLGAILSRAVTK